MSKKEMGKKVMVALGIIGAAFVLVFGVPICNRLIEKNTEENRKDPDQYWTCLVCGTENSIEDMDCKKPACAGRQTDTKG